MVDHNPAKAPELIAYQAIITSASRQYPLHAWLNYDTQFCITAASDHTLRWDTGLNALPHLQLPLSQAVSHVPIVVKPATNLRNVFFAPHLHNLLTSNQSTEVQLPTLMPEPQSAKTLTNPYALENPVSTYTSATTAEITTLTVVRSRQNSWPIPVTPLCQTFARQVPKHDGGWQVIYHLLAPAPHSINDYIDPNSLTYCTKDDAFSIINKLDPNALFSKIDLKDAFRLIPVCPEDWNLLGIQWRQHFYVQLSSNWLAFCPFLV